MIGFDYGNARIRARRTRLFDRGTYHDLANAPDVASLIGTLGSGPYGPDIESHIPRLTGVHLVDAAIDEHLARELREVCSFYEQSIRRRLELLLGRWDVKNLVALIRALSRRTGGIAPITTLVPAGRMRRPVLEELAAQPGVRGMIDLMVSWRVPSIAIANAARRSVPALELSGDPLVVETSIQLGFAREVDAVLADADLDLLTRLLEAERRAADLVTAARLREGRVAGEDLPDLDDVWLGDGRLRDGLVELVLANDLSESVATLRPLEPDIERAVIRWGQGGDAIMLADDLLRALVRMAHAGYASDPLGIGVPAAYAWDLENEARNLRLVARVVAQGLERDVADEGVFLP